MDDQAQPASSDGHIKATRQDWLDAAMDILVADGAAQVKVLTLSHKLGVSRSSFYWYFKSRQDLLDRLLDLWREKNTKAIVARAERPAETVSQAILNIFECWADPTLFDPPLDFAVREWSRRSERVRAAVQAADDERVAALTELFRRHGFGDPESFVRARVLYFMQIGYYAIESRETLDDRLALSSVYVQVFGGEPPSPDAVDAFYSFAREAEAPRR